MTKGVGWITLKIAGLLRRDSTLSFFNSYAVRPPYAHHSFVPGECAPILEEIWGAPRVLLITGRDNKILYLFSYMEVMSMLRIFAPYFNNTRSVAGICFENVEQNVLSFENQDMTHKRYRILLSRQVSCCPYNGGQWGTLLMLLLDFGHLAGCSQKNFGGRGYT